MEHCEVRRASDRAPHGPTAGTPTVSTVYEKLQIDLLFLGDMVALRVMDVSSKFSFLTPVRSESLQKASGALSSLRIGIFRLPKSIRMDEGEELQNDVWADFCSGRRIKLFLQWVGARPWILECRNGLARGLLLRLFADGRYTGGQIFAEARWRRNAMIPASGYSAFQLVFGPSVVDLYGWDDRDEDLFLAQDTSVSGQCAQQRELRMTAQGAASKEVAKSKVRRLLARSKALRYTDVEIGDAALFLQRRRIGRVSRNGEDPCASPILIELG